MMGAKGVTETMGTIGVIYVTAVMSNGDDGNDGIDWDSGVTDSRDDGNGMKGTVG